MNTGILEQKNVHFQAGEHSLQGIVTVPEQAKGMVLFVHGNGNSRLCPINSRVAKELNKNGFATFLVDLLTEDETFSTSTTQDVEFLTERLMAATKWIIAQEELRRLQMCYFSTSTGATAALNASSLLGFSLKAIISRGGSPDVSMAISESATAPVLLIAGGINNSFPSYRKGSHPTNTHKDMHFEDFGSTIDDLERLKLIADISVGWLDLYLKTSKENAAVIS